MEEWRDIPGYEGRYQASSLGRIRRLKMTLKSYSKAGNEFYYTLPERIVSGRKDKNGYLTINIRNDKGAQRSWKIHRLIATSFIPNPHNLPQVNHKNGIKDDNRRCNLEWCDAKYNLYHAHHLMPAKKMYYNQRKVIVFNEMNDIIETYETLSVGAKALGLTKQTLRHRIITGKNYNGKYYRYASIENK